MVATADIDLAGAEMPALVTGSQRISLKLGNGSVVSLNNVIAFPGLINSHDHLDFSLFPQMTGSFYNDYTEWASDIHATKKDQINYVRSIPRNLSVGWGIIKNLLAGVTSVLHHGHRISSGESFGLNVIDDYQYLHAIETEPWWKLKLLYPFARTIVIHAGEGNSEPINENVRKLFRWNFFRKDLIVAHGISFTQADAQNVRALVWCPESNLNLYGKTANAGDLKNHTKILFGTDSPLTASPDFWHHMRVARQTGMLTDSEIYRTLTKTPVEVFPDISKNTLVISKARSENVWDAFFNIRIEDILVVICEGEILLVDAGIVGQLDGYQMLYVNGEKKLLPERFVGTVRKLTTRGIGLPFDIKSTAP